MHGQQWVVQALALAGRPLLVVSRLSNSQHDACLVPARDLCSSSVMSVTKSACNLYISAAVQA